MIRELKQLGLATAALGTDLLNDDDIGRLFLGGWG